MAPLSDHHLSAQSLLAIARERWNEVFPINQAHLNSQHFTADVLMAALAMFILKFPSLLQFEKGRNDAAIRENLHTLFKLKQIPSDTQMRTLIDRVSPNKILEVFDYIFLNAQRAAVLEKYEFEKRGYLISIDGTAYFESDSIHCENCCTKRHRGKETVSYNHAFFPAVLVHPHQRQVLPMMAEAIKKDDGMTKNDCEFNAMIRLLKNLRKSHPRLRMIIVADSLFSKSPIVELLRELKMDFIIGAKPGDHTWLFDKMRASEELKEVVPVVINQDDKIHEFKFFNDFWLNLGSSEKVNFIEYIEPLKGGKTRHWSWITNIPITKENLFAIANGGRARWKIENETFNTLKNQGYEFEHNFGHGYQHLNTNFALLMLLAFLIDQLQEFGSLNFQKALKACYSRTCLWETLRSRFTSFTFKKWDLVFHSIINKSTLAVPYDTS